VFVDYKCIFFTPDRLHFKKHCQ